MGQAKQRGTYAERKAKAEALNGEAKRQREHEEELKQQERDRILAQMSPQERRNFITIVGEVKR